MSDKYILRSGAIDAINRNSGTLHTREAEFLLQKVIFLLKNAPTVDAVAVTRCKSCIYFGVNKENDPYCTNRCGLDDPVPDGFCNYGEPKGGT